MPFQTINIAANSLTNEDNKQQLSPEDIKLKLTISTVQQLLTLSTHAINVFNRLTNTVNETSERVSCLKTRVNQFEINAKEALSNPDGLPTSSVSNDNDIPSLPIDIPHLYLQTIPRSKSLEAQYKTLNKTPNLNTIYDDPKYNNIQTLYSNPDGILLQWRIDLLASIDSKENDRLQLNQMRTDRRTKNRAERDDFMAQVRRVEEEAANMHANDETDDVEDVKEVDQSADERLVL